MSDDCTRKYICEAGGKFRKSNVKGCHKQAVCQGQPRLKTCVCKPGFSGDGVKKCTGKLCYILHVCHNTLIIRQYI